MELYIGRIFEITSSNWLLIILLKRLISDDYILLVGLPVPLFIGLPYQIIYLEFRKEQNRISYLRPQTRHTTAVGLPHSNQRRATEDQNIPLVRT